MNRAKCFFRKLVVQVFFYLFESIKRSKLDYIMRLLLPAKQYRSQLQLRVLICSQNVNLFSPCRMHFSISMNIYILIIIADSFFFTITPWLASNHANKTIVLGRIFTTIEIQLKRKWTTRSANSSRKTQ